MLIKEILFFFPFLSRIYVHYKYEMHKVKEKDGKSRSKGVFYYYNVILSFFFKESAWKAKAHQQIFYYYFYFYVTI
jgi:hypothetical protein